MLRRRFIDYIRARKAGKRPQDIGRTDLEDSLMPTEERFDEILDVHKALEEMAALDPDLAELVEMVYFGGCPIQTAAEIRGVSTKTITRHLNCARGYLRERLGCLTAPEKTAITNEG
jgi:RNA polymerase sigma factor (sigma-70 family)